MAPGTASYYGRNVSNRIDLRTMERTVSGVLVGRRLTGAGLDPAKVKDLTKELDLKTIRLSEKGEREDQGAAMIFSIILLMILYMSILMWGQAVMTSVIEEKTSRVVEVMAAGVSPTTLLAGKLLGVGAAGLTQFLVWALSLFGVSVFAAGAAMGSFSMPEITPLMLVSFVLFFLLGFLFYAALYASIGAAVNTVQEAQSLAFPVMLPIILAMVCFPAVLEAPDGALAVTMSMIPGMSPLIMFLQDRGADPAAVADRPVDRAPRAGDPRRRVGRGPDLPGGHPDVREEADLPRAREVGPARLMPPRARPIVRRARGI